MRTTTPAIDTRPLFFARPSVSLRTRKIRPGDEASYHPAPPRHWHIYASSCTRLTGKEHMDYLALHKHISTVLKVFTNVESTVKNAYTVKPA